MSRIGFLGTGHIAAPMVRFLCNKGHEVWITERSADVARELESQVGAKIAGAQAILDTVEIVFICLRPAVAEGILQPLRFREDLKVHSVMAGVDLSALSHICAPASEIVRSIPYGFLEHGACPLAAVGSVGMLRPLFEPENPVIDMKSEENMRAAAAVSGMVAGVLEIYDVMARWMETRTGDAAMSEAYTTQLFTGFMRNHPSAAGALARERDIIASPLTLNLQALEVLRDMKTPEALTAAMDAVYRRLNDHE